MSLGSVDQILLEHATCVSFTYHITFTNSTTLPTLLATSHEASFTREFFGVLNTQTQLYSGRCLLYTICQLGIWQIFLLWIHFRRGCPNSTNVPVSAPASRSRRMTKLPIKLYISNTKTILHGQKQSWETIQIRCDQLTGTTWLVKIAMRARIEWSQAYQMRLGCLTCHYCLSH